MKKLTITLIVLFVVDSTHAIPPPPPASPIPPNSEEFTMMTGPKHSIMLRAPKSIGNFFRRMIGRPEKASSSQATHHSHHSQSPLSLSPGYVMQPAMGAASTFYPSFAPALPQFMTTGPMMAPSPPASYMSAASNPYASFVSPSGSPDFHAVLDSFVRSNGLTPAGAIPGDQDMSASSMVQSGDSPVFSFKKLYSFPFYLNTDNGAPGFALNIPYMKRHIRRMSSPSKAVAAATDAIKSATSFSKSNSQLMKQLQEQQKLIKALQSSEMIANYLTHYLKKQEYQQAAAQAAAINALHAKKPNRKSHPHQFQTLPMPDVMAAISHSRPEPRPEPKPEPRPEPLAEPSYSSYPSESAAYYSWNPETNSDQLYQRMAQLEELRRRRNQAANSVAAADEVLSEQLNTRIVNDHDPSYASSIPSSGSSSSSYVPSRLSDSISDLQSLSNGLRASPPSVLPPSSPSTSSQEDLRESGSRLYSSDPMDPSRDDSSLSAQESRYRPSIITYYPDPSIPEPSKMRASVLDVTAGGPQVSNKKVRGEPQAVQLSSSFSMSGL